MLLKSIKGLVRALDGAKFLDGLIAVRSGRKEHLHGEPGLVAFLGEGRRSTISV
jgi:hypothetical protein